MTAIDQAVILAISQGDHNDPFAVLGPHVQKNHQVVRTFQPQAQAVDFVDQDDALLVSMTSVHAGLFEATMPVQANYRLRLFKGESAHTIDDPYRFSSPLGEIDRYLMGEGTHLRIYDTLGARCIECEDICGVHFAVWAPNAQRVSVVGPFNEWDGRRYVMRVHPANGVGDSFLPGLASGELYKFEIKGSDGTVLPLKADPFGRRCESPPGNASRASV